MQIEFIFERFMSPRLQLVPPYVTTADVHQPTAEVRYLISAPYGKLKLAPIASNSAIVKPHYWAYICVAFAHVALLAWMIDTSTKDVLIPTVPAPMMVSLVKSPAPTKDLPLIAPAPIVPVATKNLSNEVTKANASNITSSEKKQVVTEKIALMPAVSEISPTHTAADTSTPIATLNTVVQTAALAPAVLNVTESSAAIEPPKFGAAYLFNPAPTYPTLARRLGEEGRALLRVLVAENGRAETVVIESTSGSSRLDQAAMAAVKRWEFVPAKQNRENVSAYVLVPIHFALTN